MPVLLDRTEKILRTPAHKFIERHVIQTYSVNYKTSGMTDMYRKLQLLGSAVFLLTACATPQAPEGANVIAITSTPPGATASVSSGEWCVTPCTLTRPVAGVFTVRLQKDGFEPQELRVEPEMSARTQAQFQGQLRQARRDSEMRRQTRPQRQEATYAPVTAQLQPLPGNTDAEIAALMYAQKVDPVMPRAVGSKDLKKRAALGQQFGVRVAGYDRAPVEFTPVSRVPDGAEAAAEQDDTPKEATGAPTNITASSFDRRPVAPSSLIDEEATGAVESGPSRTVDIPLEGPAAVKPTPQPVEQQVALRQPQPEKTTELPAIEKARDLGNAVVQLASFRNEALADQAVNRFRAQYSTMLGDLIPDIQKADLGEKGIYYRVRFAGFETLEEARSLCAGLSASGQGCMAVRR